MTKKYKIGDTIYAKGKIIQADESHGKFPYCVSFSDSDFTRIIDMCHAWLDEDSFVEPPAKPTLPKDVADEISFAKSIKGVTFDDYIVRELIRSDYKDSATNKMIQSPDVPNAIEVLLNAWNNGYTTDKPKLYNLVLGYDPDDTDGDTCNALNEQGGGLFIDVCSLLDDDLKSDPDYQFTQEEIDKYNKNFWMKNIDLNDYKVEVPSDD